ncbi:MAG: tRNA-dihydrouridine synthase, partial [Synergistaceae bacterium]|nr:tRNA-dihydrouridine synthase [Synergistaceae bacterium]
EALEVNMACPMPKVTKKCGGASLLLNPTGAAMIVASLKPLGLPVWVKIRKIGEKTHPLGTIDFCRKMFDAGADLLIIHGRTPAQRYEGAADKEAIFSAARKFPGLIVASGDYFTPADAELYLGGGCSAVLAARGAIKDAFLIPRTLHALGYETDEKLLDPPMADRVKMLLAAGMEAKSREGERHALVMTKRLMAGMLKGSRGVSALKQNVASCRDWVSLEEALLRFAEISVDIREPLIK